MEREPPTDKIERNFILAMRLLAIAALLFALSFTTLVVYLMVMVFSDR